MISISDAEEILKKEYHIDNFKYLLENILLPDFCADEHDVDISSPLFKETKQLGFSSQCDLTVFEVYLNKNCENKRVGITQEMFRILRKLRINNALVSFVSYSKDNYRISLLTSKYEFNGDKIEKVLSNPRRFSYSLGFGTKTKTAYKFLISKGKVTNLEDLISRFSVEVVNKQFYSEISEAFTSLIGGERNDNKYNRILFLKDVKNEIKYPEFGVRLIGRIMFCWFLREKQSENNIPLMPHELFSVEKINSTKSYYHEVLEPLFFEVLNTNVKNRKSRYNNDFYNLIPYLNGGLFSPHIDDLYHYESATGLGKFEYVSIPNSWFIKLFNILNEYNFTVDENTSYDIELSIDPEMLGRIFENLLAEINPETGENAKKSTGSFYTPREIVDYMVDNSLSQYLFNKTNIEKIKIDALLSYNKNDDYLAVFDDSEKQKLIDALYNITVLDPACGSGAFPIGMLQKIVYVLQELDPDARLWLKKATSNISGPLKKEIEEKFSVGSLNYIRKLSVIQNSIFGIDIQSIAVEISRLRCFLSLIIEEKVDDKEYNRGINPLPNLDFKFIIANSLLGLDDSSDTSLFENNDYIVQLKEVRDDYFNADNESRKDLKLTFANIQQDMLLGSAGGLVSKKYHQLSAWKPFSNEPTDWFDPDWMFGIKDGFDIVIGNPPYLKERDNKKVFDIVTATNWGKHWHQGKMDYWFYFAHKAFEILKKDGLLCFIASNYFPCSAGGKKINEQLAKCTTILKYIDFNKIMIFESADVQTMILLVENQSTEKHGDAYKYNVGTRQSISESLSTIDQSPNVIHNEITSTKSLLNSNFQLMFDNDKDAAVIAKIDSKFEKGLIKSTQGIVENPNVINNKNIKLLPKKSPYSDVKVGDEVFVVTAKTLNKINLNSEEKKFLKKYHYPSELEKYYCRDESEYFLFYLTRQNINTIDLYPNIKKHLERFKPIMDQRRETKNKSNKWFHLHWPRDEELFNGEKIIYPQMCKVPTFSYSNEPYFINMSANIIYKTNDKVNLKVLTVLLNSKLFKYWLQKTAKKRGVNIDIAVSVIDRLPINLDILSNETLVNLTNDLFEKIDKNQSTNESINKIDKEIYKLYDIIDDEIELIESI